MNRDEILKKSREENDGMDERERAVMLDASKNAFDIGGIVCCILIILECIFSHYANLGTWSVYLSMKATVHIVKYINLREKRSLVLGVIESVVAVLAFAMYVFNLVVGINGR
jgi:hypothetical protein